MLCCVVWATQFDEEPFAEAFGKKCKVNRPINTGIFYIDIRICTCNMYMYMYVCMADRVVDVWTHMCVGVAESCASPYVKAGMHVHRCTCMCVRMYVREHVSRYVCMYVRTCACA